MITTSSWCILWDCWSRSFSLLESFLAFPDCNLVQRHSFTQTEADWLDNVAFLHICPLIMGAIHKILATIDPRRVTPFLFWKLYLELSRLSLFPGGCTFWMILVLGTKLTQSQKWYPVIKDPWTQAPLIKHAKSCYGLKSALFDKIFISSHSKTQPSVFCTELCFQKVRK